MTFIEWPQYFGANNVHFHHFDWNENRSLQDYALLIGNIGLLLAVAVVMYFSKKIQW